MISQIKQRIEQIRRGEVPEGYKKTKVGIVPEEWEEERFKDKFSRLTRKNTEDNSNVLTISAQFGLINQESFFNKSIASENTTNYFLLRKGEYAYNKSYSNGYPYGALKRLEKYESGIVSPLYICFSATEENKCPEFYIQYFEAGKMNPEIKAIAQEGARNHGLLNISVDDFFNAFIIVPPLQEQEKIAEILQTQDKVIELQQKKIDELKRLKKVYLSKMFPKKGCNIPEIRFPGFTDPWEQRKLGDLAIFNPKTELPDVFEYVDLESVVGTEMLTHRTESKRTAPSRAQRLAQTGDLFYQTVRPYQKNNYLFEKPDKHYVFSTGYAQMRPIVDGRFLLCLVQNESFVKVVLDNCTGTSYPAINSNDLAEIEVYSPGNAQEQKQIGDFFKGIDDLITLHQRKCDEEKQKKKALMQLLLTGIVRT